MRALFIGGSVDNSELDLDTDHPPLHYPENTGAGRARYRLHHIGVRDEGEVAYVVYAAPDLADEVVSTISDERNYSRRFQATPALVAR